MDLPTLATKLRQIGAFLATDSDPKPGSTICVKAVVTEVIDSSFARTGFFRDDPIWHVAAADLRQRWGVYPNEGAVLETGISTVLGVTQFACSAEKRLYLMSVLPGSAVEARPGLIAQCDG